MGHGPSPFLRDFWYAAPRAERENEVGCGDVGICTYLYLFSDQSASFFDSTRSSFSICFQLVSSYDSSIGSPFHSGGIPIYGFLRVRLM